MNNNPDDLCACGCGKTIPPNPKRRKPAKYICGHHTRVDSREGRPHHVYVPLPEEIPSGLCECGCGKETTISKDTIRSRRWFRGYPLPRLPGHGTVEYVRTGKRWMGKKYWIVYAPEHPNSDASGCVPEHILIASQKIGRPLMDGEEVHHQNRIKTDNRPENLIVVTKAEHSKLHPEKLEAMWAVMTPERYSKYGKRGAEARWRKKDS